MGKILYTVIATVGDLERSLIRERWMVGRERTKAQGKTVGRPPTEVDEETIHHLRDKGLKLRVIRRSLGISQIQIKQVTVKMA